MGHTSGLSSIKSRRLQITLREAGAEQSLLNASLGNTGTLWKISHASAIHLVELSEDQNY